MTDPRYAVWLQCALGQGGALPTEILRRYSSFEAFYRGGAEEWRLSGLFREKQLERLTHTSLQQAEQILRTCAAEQQTILTLEENAYPLRLKQIADPPAVLYVSGSLPTDFDQRIALAVVGTRDATPSGVRIAMELCNQLAQKEVVIVSGGALGLDTAAHKGALLGGGCTVAVLGCGINTRYLTENLPLRNQIRKSGALISEYPPGTPAKSYHFPVRNRIISGLSSGTLVVEAGEKSGSLITAKLALEQGRDVFAVPGDLLNYRSGGSNRLLREGAKPVLDISDILEEYHPITTPPPAEKDSVAGNRSWESEEKTTEEDTAMFSAEATALLRVMKREPIPIDELAAAANLSAREALGAVTELEMEARIEAYPGKRYRLL